MVSKTRKIKGKPSQWATIWLFPLIAIGGLFYPLLGYLMLVMMILLLGLAYFKSRYWCGNFCPRGAFLDIVQSQFTLNRPWPRLFNRKGFRWFVFGLFMTIFVSRLMASGGNLVAIGGVFVSMCIVTSILAIIFGTATRPRAWCAICPMGTLQEQLGRWGKANRKRQQQLLSAQEQVRDR